MSKKNLSRVLVSGALLLGACGTPISNPALAPQRQNAGERPPIGEEAQASVGEVAYVIFDYSEKKGARLDSAFSRSFYAGEIFVPGDEILIPAPDGSYCTESPTFSSAQEDAAVCFLDTDNDGKFEQQRADTRNKMFLGSNWRPLKVVDEIGYSAGWQDQPGGFRRELVLLGISGTELRLGYREYQGDMRRPAFDEELTYNLEGPTTIRFREAEIEILEAGNQGIRYIVHRGLDPL